jgi:hypothetical protein
VRNLPFRRSDGAQRNAETSTKMASHAKTVISHAIAIELCWVENARRAPGILTEANAGPYGMKPENFLGNEAAL